jgi:hypothetical protein
MAQDDFVNTPFGKVPRECFSQHPRGTTASAIPNGVRIRLADGTTKDYVSSERCVSFVRSLRSRKAKPGMTPTIPSGWFNYAAWYAPQGIGTFAATYTLPQLPAQAGNQDLYYYIGLENGADPNSPILQPVLGYDQSASGGYTLTSFVVGPSGPVMQGPVVTGMGPDATVNVSIVQTAASTYSVNASWQGQKSDISWNGEVLNSPYVTLEIDYVNACNQFLTGAFAFGNLSLTDLNGNSLTPSWAVEPSGGTVCNGNLAVNGSTITIQQNLSSR